MFQTISPFIMNYLKALSSELKKEQGSQELSATQLFWFGICIMGIMLTNQVNWAKFSKVSLGQYSKAALSKMCLRGKVAWNRLLSCSARMILKKFKVSEGVLVLDDKDLRRSKNVSKIHGAHKQKDKATGGYCIGQNIVMLYLVTPYFCLPISFMFYVPDPEISAWTREKRLHKKHGSKEKFRPAPERSKKHPKKYEIALDLLNEFSKEFPDFTVHNVLADALYGNSRFLNEVKYIFPRSQMVSQIRNNQIVYFRGKRMSVTKYFESYRGWSQKVIIRGGKERNVIAGGARIFVKALGRKCFVIALKYEGEEAYRYLIANDLSWNMTSVMQSYTLRWLIEVFFEDWSCYCGFCSLAKQRGYEGSARPLILSLLFDHCFLLHPAQQSFIEEREPLATLGSLISQSQSEALCQFFSDIINHEDSSTEWAKIEVKIKSIFYVFQKSSKHMNGRETAFKPERSAMAT